jgi:hypothetical protein
MTESDIVQRALDVVYDPQERFYNSKWNLLYPRRRWENSSNDA